MAIDELDLRGTLSTACAQAGEALSVDKVDLFVYQSEGEVLGALGTSDTETGAGSARSGSSTTQSLQQLPALSAEILA